MQDENSAAASSDDAPTISPQEVRYIPGQDTLDASFYRSANPFEETRNRNTTMLVTATLGKGRDTGKLVVSILLPPAGSKLTAAEEIIFRSLKKDVLANINYSITRLRAPRQLISL